MKNLKNVLRTKRNNRGLFLQLSVFALFAMLTLFSGQTLANQFICTPTTTVNEGNLFPGGIVSFGVTSGPLSVTVDHVNAGSGLRMLDLLSEAANATVIISAFPAGTFAPVVVTFTPINPALPVEFTLRAASRFHAANIRVRCGCTPRTTVTDDPAFPGGIVSFVVTSGTGSVTVDHVNAGTGLRVFSVVSATNVVINIPAFTPGTFNPVSATFTVIDPNQPVNFTLRASNQFHGVLINGVLPVTLSTSVTVTECTG